MGENATPRSPSKQLCFLSIEPRVAPLRTPPSCSHHFSQEFGYRNNTPAREAVLNGTYTPPPGTDPSAAALLAGLHYPAPPPPHVHLYELVQYITTEDHIKGWRKAKEKTSAGLSGLHFGLY